MLPRDGQVRRTPLRRELERLTTSLTYERIGEQAPAIEALRAIHPHSLELVAAAVPGRPETYRFTCFQHAFKLMDPPESIVEICTRFPDIFPNGEFVSFLISEYLTLVDPALATDGDVVVYLSDTRPVHAAVIEGNQLRSKWGLAHMWRHRVDEVPEKYGDRVLAFKPLSREVAVAAFLTFASRKGAGDGV